LGRIDVSEHCDPSDLFRGHHEVHDRSRLGSALSSITRAPETTKQRSHLVLLDTGTR